MSQKAYYETSHGVETFERDEIHTEKDGWVIGYNLPDGRGVEEKISVPKRRVIKILGAPPKRSP